MANPYGSKSYEHITDVSKYFKYDDKKKTMLFVGSELKCYVSSRWEVYGHLEVSDTVTTVGIADLIIDDKYQASLFMMAKIEMDYGEIGTKLIDGIQYYVLTLHHGDRFICNTELIKDSNLVYAIYSEMVGKGNYIYTLDYDHIAFILDQSKSMCDANLKVDHVIFEMIYSHLSRDKDNLAIQYRHTDMTKPAEFIPIRSVSYAPDSTTARVLGSYFEQGLNSSLLQEQGDSLQPLEQLLR